MVPRINVCFIRRHVGDDAPGCSQLNLFDPSKHLCSDPFLELEFAESKFSKMDVQYNMMPDFFLIFETDLLVGAQQ